MTKEYHKKFEELNLAFKVIDMLGYKPSLAMSDEGPDFVLPSKDDRQIGIEVTKYIYQKKAKDIAALNCFLNDYANHFDENNQMHGEITIYFNYGELPTGIPFKDIKKQLFLEIDQLILSEDIGIKQQYIEEAYFDENPSVHNSCAHLGLSGYEYGNVNPDHLQHCIQKKEHKLKDYKEDAKNATIKEFYLIIYASPSEHPEVRKYKLPDGFKSQYDRIYFVDDFEINQLK